MRLKTINKINTKLFSRTLLALSFSFILIMPGVTEICEGAAPQISGLDESYSLTGSEVFSEFFTITHTPNKAITITVVSDNPDVVPNDYEHIKIYDQPSPLVIFIPETGILNVQLIIQHKSYIFGATNIQVSAADGSDVSSTTFELTFSKYCDFSRPWKSFSKTTGFMNTLKRIDFQISGLCTQLLVSVNSSDSELIPNDSSHINIRDKATAEALGFQRVSIEFGDYSETKSFTLELLPQNFAGVSTITVEIQYSMFEPSEFHNFDILIGLQPFEGGDVNHDGVLMMEDIILALRVACGFVDSGVYVDDGGSTTISADVDGDTRIGLAEAIFVMQKYAGLR